MSSTYLELTNKVLRRLNEVELTSATFASAKGVYNTVKDAINSSINSINSEEYEWPFNFNEEESVTLTVGENYYAFPADYKVADWNSFFIFADGTIENENTKLKLINKDDYFRYKREEDFNNTTNGIGRPEFVFPYGNNQFGVTCVPDQEYVLKYNYWNTPTQLSAYNDTTNIPSHFDYVIVDGAMWYGDLFKSDEGGADRALKQFEKGLKHMRSILINPDQDITSGMINFGKRRTGTHTIKTG